MSNKGLKYDDGKLLMSLVKPEFIEGVAEVLTYGANKYAPNSWQNVEDGKRRYTDALLRHLNQYLKGEEKDDESGLEHLKHIATNIMFLQHLDDNNSKPDKCNCNNKDIYYKFISSFRE